jgi:hypothetical protein
MNAITYCVLVIHMVGDTQARSRPVLSVLLLGLVLLVAAHLLGALHGPGFARHTPVAGSAVSHAALVDAPHAVATPGPAHHHDYGFDDSIEHAVDRLRAPADQAIDAPGDAGPFTYEAAAVAVPAVSAAGTLGAHGPSEAGSAHALHCIWRQ